MSAFSFQSLALSVCLFGASAGVIAANEVTICPSPELIQKTFVDNNHSFFTEIDINLISFDVSTNMLNTLVTTINYVNDGAEVMSVANIKASAEQNPEEIAYQSIANMQSENETPVVFHIHDEMEGHLIVGLCSYHAANDSDIKGTFFTVKAGAAAALDASFAKRLKARLKHGLLLGSHCVPAQG